MFKKNDLKNLILLKFILLLGIIYGGVFGIYLKVDVLI